MLRHLFVRSVMFVGLVSASGAFLAIPYLTLQ
jgi:hypothetical protein